MSNEKKINLKYSPDLSGKFLFMRHGQTWYNRTTELSRGYNPDLCDSHLSDEGINQIKLSQETINKLNLEKVYVSPYYRALQTCTLALENYPELKNLQIIVHPKISEVCCGGHDFIFEIKQTKKDFNMNSKVKIDWSYFDNYVKEINYDENFFYFENINLIDEKEKNEEYLKLKKLYEEKDEKKGYKEELKRFLEEKKKILPRFESLKHAYQRFEDFKNFLKNEHKDTINDLNKKILCISHSTFIKTASSPEPFLIDKIEENTDHLYKIKNGEIITLFL